MHYKKTLNILLGAVFSLSFSAFMSLGITCLFQLVAILFAMNDYPRLVPFCLIVGMLALFAILITLCLNVWAAVKLEFSVSSWIVEVIGIGFFPWPMIIVWQIVLQFLSTTF